MSPCVCSAQLQPHDVLPGVCPQDSKQLPVLLTSLAPAEQAVVRAAVIARRLAGLPDEEGAA